MSYPATRLNKRLRHLVMVILISSFFVISPLIILYTTGYRYDFKSGKIQETGVISIDAMPRDAQVYLNNVLLNQQLPIRLPNHAPGTYTIAIKKSGYYDWNKEINVESKQTTYIKNITLFKKSLPILITNKNNIADWLPNKTGNYWLTVNHNQATYEIQLYNTISNQFIPIWRGNTSVQPKISWSFFNDLGLAILTYKDHQSILLIDPLDQNNFKEFSLNLETNDTVVYQWSKSSPGIFVKEKDDNTQLYKINFYSLSQGSQITLGLVSSTVWYAEEGNNYGTIWNVANDQKIIQKKFQTNLTGSIQLPQVINSIIDANDQRIITKSNNNSLIIIKIANGISTGENTTLNTQSLFYNLATKEWLTWSPAELWSIHDDGSIILLNRISEKINFVIPLDYYGELLIASNNQATAFNRGYYVTQEMLSNNIEINNIVADINNRKIYFDGKLGQTAGIWEMDY